MAPSCSSVISFLTSLPKRVLVSDEIAAGTNQATTYNLSVYTTYVLFVYND